MNLGVTQEEGGEVWPEDPTASQSPPLCELDGTRLIKVGLAVAMRERGMVTTEAAWRVFIMWGRNRSLTFPSRSASTQKEG